MAMTTVDELKLRYADTPPASDDALLVELQAAAESFAASYTGRDFAGGSFAETHPAAGNAVFLRNFPVASVTAVQATGEQPRPPSGYAVHAERGVVEALGAPFPRGAEVSVTYTAATGQVPAAVRQAVAELVGHWLREAKTHAATGQLNVASTTAAGATTAYPWGQSTGYRVPPGVLALLRPFRCPVI